MTEPDGTPEQSIRRVLIAHNRYRQSGGEDVVVTAETRLLQQHGHEVSQYSLDNRDIAEADRLRTAGRTLWSRSSHREMTRILRQDRPTIAHFHNTFPLMSPAVYYAARKVGVVVVQTLHNYRLICPNALLFRNGRVCEDCVGRAVPWPGVVHACYRGSRPASAAVAGMVALHRGLGTWRHAVDAYIAPTEFARKKLVEGGLPADRIAVKPHFLHEDPGHGEHGGGYALFVGRLSVEKGLATLLQAWARLSDALPLKILGTGPAGPPAVSPAGVEWLGAQPRERVLALMRDAALLIFPSECYEAFPMVLAEAFATGLPVMASRLGAAAEVVVDGFSGRLFTPGDPADLASTVTWMIAHRPEALAMGRNGRSEFEAKYTAATNYALLREIYLNAVERAAAVSR